MKKIGKLAINAEKVIKNEELINLRGGYGDGDMACYYYSDDAGTNLICCKVVNSSSACNDNVPSGTAFTSYNTKTACSSVKHLGQEIISCPF